MNPTPPILQRQLSPGETLLWEGQPSVLRHALVGLWGTLFGLLFVGGGLFFAAMTARAGTFASGLGGFFPDSRGPQGFSLPRISSPVDLMPYVGLLFALIGLWLVLMPVWSALSARRTFYGVTDRRALMLEGGAFGGLRVRSFLPGQLGQFDKLERMDGSGSLLFSSELYQTTETVNTTVYTHTTHAGHLGTPQGGFGSVDPQHTHIRSSRPVLRVRRIGFVEVPDVTAAEQALRQLLRLP